MFFIFFYEHPQNEIERQYNFSMEMYRLKLRLIAIKRELGL